MARVDVGDDSIRRFVVRHYRYDPDRRERRHVLVAAFDNRREFEQCLQAVSADIDRRRAAGEPVDAKEYVSGVVREAGGDMRAANGRLVVRAIGHGVTPGPWVRRLPLPPNIAVRSADDEPRPGWRRGARRLLQRMRRGADDS
jgi:nitroreductase